MKYYKVSSAYGFQIWKIGECEKEFIGEIRLEDDVVDELVKKLNELEEKKQNGKKTN